MELLFEGGEVGKRAVNMCARAWSLQTTCTIWCNWKEISRNTFEAGYMMSMMSTNRWILHFKGCPLNNTQFVRTCALIMLHPPCLGRFGTKWPKYSEVMGFQSTMGSPKKADRPTTKKPKETSGRPLRGKGLFWGWGSKIVAWRRFIWIICSFSFNYAFWPTGACKDNKNHPFVGANHVYPIQYLRHIHSNSISFSPLTVESNKPTWTLTLKQDTLPFEIKLDWQHTHTENT